MLKIKLQELKRQVINQSNIIEKMINNSIDGLIKRDKSTLDLVISTQEPKVNTNEMIIDEICLNSIALYHPEASDLRIILMIQKINNDLERMGDLAVNICEDAHYLITRPEIKSYVDLPKMAEKTICMVKNSIVSFIDKDINLANNVLNSDDIVDDLQDVIIKDIESIMLKQSDVIKRSLKVLNIASHLERIADLSTNIAEDVIFMVKGKVVKHRSKIEK